MPDATLRRYALLAARSAAARVHARIAPTPHSAYAAWWLLVQEVAALLRARGVPHALATPDEVSRALQLVLSGYDLTAYFYSVAAMTTAVATNEAIFARGGSR